MKYWSLFFCICTVFCLPLRANLVRNQSFDFIQPDSSRLSLLVSGDEIYHRVHDKDGFTILKHPQTGYAVYAIPDGNSIKASDYRVGDTNPAALGIQPNLTIDRDIISARISEQQRLRNQGDRAVPTGTLKNVVCFLRFSGENLNSPPPTTGLFMTIYTIPRARHPSRTTSIRCPQDS